MESPSFENQGDARAKPNAERMTNNGVGGFVKRLLPVVVIAAVLALGWNALRSRPVKIEVVQAASQQLAEVIALSGRARGVQESQLAPEITGTVRQLLVSEGQTVSKGQQLAVLDTQRLQAQLDQSLQRVRVAEAQLAVAKRGPLPSQLEQVRSEVDAQRLAAAASVRSAEQKLLEVQRGPRVEQIQRAEASLREARAEAEQKLREAERQRKLVADGAVAQQNAEQAQTLAKRSRENVSLAEAQLQELQRGTRPEQIEQARAAVQAAQADLLSAQEAGEARVKQLLDQPRAEDVQLAAAQLAEARLGAQVVKEQMEQAIVLAPYDGVVGRRLLRVGDQAGPNQPVFSFSSRPALEIRVDIDESDRAQVAPGLKAEIRANGYSDTFQAELKELSPEVDTVRGTLEARLRPLRPPSWLVPGQTVDVNLLLTEQKAQLMLPLTCVMLKGDKAEVMVVDGGSVVRAREVTISSPTAGGYLVRSGLKAGELVALYPQGLADGQEVRTEQP